MSTAWTADRLDALPSGTVIEWTERGCVMQAVRGVGLAHTSTLMDGAAWWMAGYFLHQSSGDILTDADPGSIRVVSVPIDALLADETVRMAAQGHYLGQLNSRTRGALQAAVAHITGEATE